MRCLDRYYMKKYRRLAIRNWRRNTASALRMERFRRILLGLAVFAEVFWGIRGWERIGVYLKNELRYTSIHERRLIDEPKDSAGLDGGLSLEGVNIRLEDRAVSIFRVREEAVPAND